MLNKKVLDPYRSSSHPVHNETKSFESIPSPHPVHNETKSLGTIPSLHPLDATAKKIKWQSISNQEF